METMHAPLPQARDERLVVQELSDEVLVYDLDRHRAHSLNRTAALVWRRCDGRTTVSEMAAMLRQELAAPVDEEAVWIALQRLGRAHLLCEQLWVPASADRASRRALLRTLAMAGGLATVTSIVAPQAAAQGTPIPCLKEETCAAFGNHCCKCKTGDTGFCTANCGEACNQFCKSFDGSTPGDTKCPFTA
jgi:hypothetical protein